MPPCVQLVVESVEAAAPAATAALEDTPCNDESCEIDEDMKTEEKEDDEEKEEREDRIQGEQQQKDKIVEETDFLLRLLDESRRVAAKKADEDKPALDMEGNELRRQQLLDFIDQRLGSEMTALRTEINGALERIKSDSERDSDSSTDEENTLEKTHPTLWNNIIDYASALVGMITPIVQKMMEEETTEKVS